MNKWLEQYFRNEESLLNFIFSRINQAQSEDMVSVSTFYSKELEGLVRKVLYVIPETMISLLEEIIRLQTELKELPTRIDREHQRDFAQLDERFKARLVSNPLSLASIKNILFVHILTFSSIILYLCFTENDA